MADSQSPIAESGRLMGPAGAERVGGNILPFLGVALRSNVDSVRSNVDGCASKGGQAWPCGPGGGRSVAEADGRPTGPGARAGRCGLFGAVSAS